MKELREILPFKDIRTIYLTLFESIISYGIIGWGGAYNNALLTLQKCQNTILRVAYKKNWRFPTEKLFEDFNVLNIELLYLKTITIYLKKHNQLDSINHGVNTRYAASNFSLDWPSKTSCRKVYYFLGKQILNLMPNDMVILPLPIFKKKINHWLRYEYVCKTKNCM